MGEPETSSDEELAVYGVVGLKRSQAGAEGGTLALVREGRRTRAVRTSESLTFAGAEGGTIKVTSHRPGRRAVRDHPRGGRDRPFPCLAGR